MTCNNDHPAGSPDNKEYRFVKFLGGGETITVTGKLYGIGDEFHNMLPFSFSESFLVNGKTDCRIVNLFSRVCFVNNGFDRDLENIYANLLRDMERFGTPGEPPFQKNRQKRNTETCYCSANPCECFRFENQRPKNEFDIHEFVSDHIGCFFILFMILILFGISCPFLIK